MDTLGAHGANNRLLSLSYALFDQDYTDTTTTTTTQSDLSGTAMCPESEVMEHHPMFMRLAQVSTAAEPIHCPKGFFFNSDPESGRQLSCQECMTGCAECESATVCKACATWNGFYLDHSDNTCKKCSPGCLTCNSADTCDICRNGLQSQNNLCPCPLASPPDALEQLDYTTIFIPQQNPMGVCGPDYTELLKNQVSLSKLHIVTKNIDYVDFKLFTEDGLYTCEQIINTSGALDPVNDKEVVESLGLLRCFMYRVREDGSVATESQPWDKKTLISIMNIKDPLKEALKKGKVVFSLNADAIQRDCTGGTPSFASLALKVDKNNGPQQGYCMKWNTNLKSQCTKCIGDQYLDLKTYQCLEQCPQNTLALRSYFTLNGNEESKYINYCRPYDSKQNLLTYYVDTKFDKTFEDGTETNPFSNLAFPFIEIFNFRSQLQSKGLQYRILLSTQEEHTVYSGRFPLFSLSSDITLEPWNPQTPDTQATVLFHKVFGLPLENYYYALLGGRSLGHLNYLYRDLPHPAFAQVFYDLYPQSYLTICSSQLKFKSVHFKQLGTLNKDDAIIQVVGEYNTTVDANRCKIDVKAFILNNMPTGITVTDSEIRLQQATYFINAGTKLPIANSVVTLRNNLFTDDNSVFGLVHNFPLIYVEGYKSVIIEDNTFRYWKDLRGMPTISVIHANCSNQAEASLSYKQNKIENSHDFCAFFASEQVDPPLKWQMDIHENSVKHCQQQQLPVMKVRLNAETSGAVDCLKNSYYNVSLINLSDENQESKPPRYTTTLFGFINMPQATLTMTQESYASIKTYKLLSVRDSLSFIQTENSYSDIRTTEVCNLAVFDEEDARDDDAVTSFINVRNVQKTSFNLNKYQEITLGTKQILNRFTSSPHITITNTLYQSLTLFDGSRLALFQDHSQLEFSNNVVKDYHLTDEMGSFLIWVLQTLEDGSVATITKFLGNSLQTGDRRIGFLWFEQVSQPGANSQLIISQNKFDSVPASEAPNMIKILGDHADDLQIQSDINPICEPDEFQDTVCKVCPITHCDICGGPAFCFRCASTYRFDANQVKCLPIQQSLANSWCPYLSASDIYYCGEGKLYDQVGKNCKDCIQNCEVCSDFQSCRQCKIGFQYNEQTQQCESTQGTTPKEASYPYDQELSCTAGCVSCGREDQKCKECGYNSIQKVLSNDEVRCDCSFTPNKVAFVVNVEHQTKTLYISVDNIALREEVQDLQIKFEDVLTTQNTQLDNLMKGKLMENYILEYNDQEQTLLDGTNLQWVQSRSQFKFSDVPDDFFNAFKEPNTAGNALSLKIDLFEYRHCQYPVDVYHNLYTFSTDSFSYSEETDPEKPPIEDLPVINKIQDTDDPNFGNDQINMKLETEKGYGFSTFFGVLLDTEMHTRVKNVSKDATDEEIEETQWLNLVFCDIFVRDPILGMDVRLNSKHFHFTPEMEEDVRGVETHSGKMDLEIKTNFPYFPGNHEQVTIMTKCKKVTKWGEEDSYTNEEKNIPYEIVLAKTIQVQLNTKFFTLYSVGDSMKLPLAYLLKYQIDAYKDKLQPSQVINAYGLMSSSLSKMKAESLDDKKLISLLLKQLSEELKSNPNLSKEDQSKISTDLKQALKDQVTVVGNSSNNTNDSSNCNTTEIISELSTVDQKNTKPTQYKPIQQDTFMQIGSTIDNLLTLSKQATSQQTISKTESEESARTKQTAQSQIDLLNTFQKSMSAAGQNLQTNAQPLSIQGQSVSGSVQKVDTTSVIASGTTVSVPTTSASSKITNSQIKVDIPPAVNQLSQYQDVTVRATAVDPKVVTQTGSAKPKDDKQFASNILVVNIDATTDQSQSPPPVQTLNIQNLKQPVNIQIPLTEAKPHDTYQCSYYNPSTETWEALPGGLSDDMQSMNCQTTHLSQFAILAQRSDNRAWVYAIITFLDVLLIGSLIAAIYLDKKDLQQSSQQNGIGNTPKPTSFDITRKKRPINLNDTGDFEQPNNSKKRRDKQQQQKKKNQNPEEDEDTIQNSSEDEMVMRDEYEEDEPQSRSGSSKRKREMYGESQSACEQYRSIVVANNTLGSQFNKQGDNSRTMRTWHMQSKFHLAIILLSVFTFVYPILAKLTLVGNLIVVFIIMRFYQFGLNKLTEKLLGKKWIIIILTSLVYLSSQIVPIVLTQFEPSIARDIAVLTIVLFVIEIFLWDLLLYPGSVIAYRKCKKQETNTMKDL